ncbi:MAG: hypothetical protein QM500_21325 [Methylococcales bacterium]
MATNVHDACKWLSTSPTQDDIEKTLNALKIKKSSLESLEVERVIMILESAVDDLSNSKQVSSYKELVDIFNMQDQETNSINKTKVSADFGNIDSSSLVDPSYLDENIKPLSNEERKNKFKELKMLFNTSIPVGS